MQLRAAPAYFFFDTTSVRLKVVPGGKKGTEEVQYCGAKLAIGGRA